MTAPETAVPTAETQAPTGVVLSDPAAEKVKALLAALGFLTGARGLAPALFHARGGAGGGAGESAEERQGLYGPRVPVPADAPAMDRLLGLTGRDPRWRP